MKKQIFSVFDKKARSYSNPFLSLNEGMAVRDFTAACRDPSLDLHKFPEDFTLHHLGSFDDEFGQFELNPNPVSIITAVQCQE